MSDYKVTDTELISVADAIRTKGGTSAQLEWPAGFVSAIGNISGGGGTAPELPSGYTQVLYIASRTVTTNSVTDTASYINTNVYPTANTRIHICLDCLIRGTEDSPNSWVCFIGSRDGTYRNEIVNATNSGGVGIVYGTSGQSEFSSINAYGKCLNIRETGSEILINGTSLAYDPTKKVSVSQPMGIGATIQESGYNMLSIINLYMCKIYDGNTLVRDFVPCIQDSTSKAGLYDLVNDVFYANANISKWDFEAGPEYSGVRFGDDS